MRVCKKCQLVKFDWQMYKRELGYAYDETTWVCKKCAAQIGGEAIENELEK